MHIFLIAFVSESSQQIAQIEIIDSVALQLQGEIGFPEMLKPGEGKSSDVNHRLQVESLAEVNELSDGAGGGSDGID